MSVAAPGHVHVSVHRPYARRQRVESSVTEVLKYLPADGLPWGAAKETAIFAYHHRDQWEHLDATEAIDRLRKHHRGVWDGRAAMGTLLHKANEARASHVPFPLADEIEALIDSDKAASIWKSMDREDVFEQALGYLIGLDNWWDDFTPEVIATEAVLRCPGFHIGQMDLAMQLRIDGRLVVVDLKTTAQQDEDKALYLDKWIYQTNTYNFSTEQVFYREDEKGRLEECCTQPWEPGEACAVVHLRGNPDGGSDGRGYEYFELPCGPEIHEQFHQLCGFHQHHKSLPGPRAVRRVR